MFGVARHALLPRWLSPAAHAAAWGEVVRAATGSEQREGWDRLLQMAAAPGRGDAAVRQLVWCAPLVPRPWLEELRGLRTLTARLDVAVADLLRSDATAARAAAIEVVGALVMPACAGHLVRAACGPDVDLAERAERALLHLAEQAGQMSRRTRRAEGAGLLAAALWQGVGEVPAAGSRGRRARLAMCVLVEAGIRPARGTGAAVPCWITDEAGPGLLGMRRVLKTSPLACVCAAAWRWLAVPTLAGAAALRLTGGAGEESAAHLAWRSLRFHLGLNPLRARGLARLVSDEGGLPVSFVPDARTLSIQSPAVRAGHARTLGMFTGAGRVREAALAALVADPFPTVRHAAARTALGMARGAGLLTDLCFDGDRRVARTAALGLWARGEPLPARCHELADPVVRDLAVHGLAGADPLAAEHPAGRLALRRQLASGDGATLLRRALVLEHGPDCVRAARAVRLVGCAGAFAPELLALLSAARAGSDGLAERAGSAALGALADVPTREAGTAIADAVRSPSARLRAAAIDASVRRARRMRDPGEAGALAEALAELRDDPAHRSRASAGRGLVSLGAMALGTVGAEHLGERIVVRMLRDDRDGHRAAGLWAAERMAARLAGHPAVMDAVGGLTRQMESKLDPIVAERSQRAAERLVIEVRGAWARAGAGVGAEPVQEGSAAA